MGSKRGKVVAAMWVLGAAALVALPGGAAVFPAAHEGPPATGSAHASEPLIFGPGVISGPADDADPAFMPDGRTIVFARNGVLMIAARTGASWSAPAIAPFSGEWNDQQPAMAPDGTYLVFVSNRPVTPDGPRVAGNLWRVQWRDGAWGQPVHLPPQVNRTASIWAPAIGGDGSLYFIARGAAAAAAGGVGSTPFRIWRAQRRADGGYADAVPQSFGDPSSQDVDPALPPDESFIVFGSRRGAPEAHERLYIACRTASGWSAPQDLGPQINGDGSTDVNEGRLSPDGQTLYFSTDRALSRPTPSTREEAEAMLARAAAWDTGRQNIWSVALAPIKARCNPAR